jgi:hypothetical protein
MRLPRPRFSLRGLMVAVAIAALISSFLAYVRLLWTERFDWWAIPAAAFLTICFALDAAIPPALIYLTYRASVRVRCRFRPRQADTPEASAPRDPIPSPIPTGSHFDLKPAPDPSP